MSAFDVQASGAVSGETAKVCQTLASSIATQKEEIHRLKNLRDGETGPWKLVKAAAQMVYGGFASSPDSEEAFDEHSFRQLKKNMRHMKQHYRAVCKDAGVKPLGINADGMMGPVDALVSLLPRLTTREERKGIEDAPLSAEDFETTPLHHLAPKPAPNEPVTEIISGAGLAKAGVVDNVPARLMYTQTSDGEPRVVWKFEVQKRDSWYEAYVDVSTGELLRIVDWASDFTWDPIDKLMKGGKQKPLPPPSEIEPYSYQVFPWGEFSSLRLFSV